MIWERFPSETYPHFRWKAVWGSVRLWCAVPWAVGLDLGPLHCSWYSRRLRRAHGADGPRMRVWRGDLPFGL